LFTVVSRSVMSENSIAGIDADPGADVVVDRVGLADRRGRRQGRIGQARAGKSSMTAIA
jgi:hypothetical protein